MAETAQQLNTFVTLEPITCYLCGVAFGVPESFKKKRLNDHNDFWCPNGHRQHFIGQTEEERLRQQLWSANNSRDFYARRLQEEVKSKRALRAHLTRAKKSLERVSRGVCPCCNRSFENLRRHMATKHPAYAKEKKA